MNPITGICGTKVDKQSNPNLEFEDFISGIKTINLVIPKLMPNIQEFCEEFSYSFKTKLINKGFILKYAKKDDLNYSRTKFSCDESYVTFDWEGGYMAPCHDFQIEFKSCNGDIWLINYNGNVTDTNEFNRVLDSLLDFQYNYDVNKRLKKNQFQITEFKSEIIVKSTLKNKINSEIEGIYESFNISENKHCPKYVIAIIQDKFDEDKFNIIYLGGGQYSEDWTAGEMKGYIIRTSKPNFYKTIWHMPKKFESKDVYSSFDENGLLCLSFEDQNEPSKYLKLFPTNKSNNIDGSIKNDDKNLKGTGSGFLISNSGLIVTNYHVISEGTQYKIAFPIKKITKNAKLLLKDVQNDIAILEIENFSFKDISVLNIPFNIADNNSINVGQEVFTLGFPLGDIMGTTPRLATGTINSLYGIEDDPRLYQISNPIQPGNSGGALFNRKGELVGICVSGLNAKYFYEKQGIIPQNMNFAIKASYIQNLIGMMSDSDEIIKRPNTLKNSSLEEQIKQLNPFIVQIRVY